MKGISIVHMGCIAAVLRIVLAKNPMILLHTRNYSLPTILFCYDFLLTACFISFLGFRMSATCFVQPLDLVKTRMQMSGVYTIKIFFNVSWE